MDPVPGSGPWGRGRGDPCGDAAAFSLLALELSADRRHAGQLKRGGCHLEPTEQVLCWHESQHVSQDLGLAPSPQLLPEGSVFTAVLTEHVAAPVLPLDDALTTS